MKSLKTSSLFRLAALLIIAIIVICMVGFVAQEWQDDKEKQPESGKTDENSGNTDVCEILERSEYFADFEAWNSPSSEVVNNGCSKDTDKNRTLNL